MRPTDEQMHALALFRSGESMVIEAGAGTGKTSTLRLLAASTLRQGRYMAFNRAIVDDVRGSISRRCEARTIHSLAFAGCGVRYKQRLDASGRMKGLEIARLLDIRAPIWVETDGVRKALEEGYLGSHVLRAIKIFCQTADEAPGPRHFPYIEGIDPPDGDGHRTFENNRLIASELEPALERAWADLCSLEGGLPFEHAHYLKLWQLEHPRLSCDYILFDEAQDANPVMAAVVADQDHAQVVYVGDSAQCQPVGTLVSVVRSPASRGRAAVVESVPIENVAEGDTVLSFSLPHSHLHRQGRRVLRRAARPYAGPLILVTAVSGEETAVTPEHRCVVRIGGALVGRWVVYLMRRGNSFRVGMTQGTYDSQGGDLGLPKRVARERADAAWVLSLHNSLEEARVAEARTAWRYGLPTLLFTAGAAMTQQELDRFWDEMGDLSPNADVCLQAHGRLAAHPLISAGQRLYRNRSQVMAAANLLDGMLMLPLRGALAADGKQVSRKQWRPVTVSRTWYSGHVHSLEVEEHGTYIADGLVTHNSIYEWTGAINALAGFAGARSLLSQSFRFGQAIADAANEALALLSEPPALTLRGLESIDSTVGRLEAGQVPSAILTRTNACAITELLRAQEQGIEGHIVGGGNEVAAFARAAQELMVQGRTYHPELRCFVSWSEVQQYVANDALGGELRLMVELVDRFGVATILRAVDSMPPENAAELVVSTAHKAKGREWPVVRLAEDFTDRLLDDAEVRLRYVAITRAREHLDKTALEPAEAEPQDGGVGGDSGE